MSCYGASAQLRNGKGNTDDIRFHPMDRLAVFDLANPPQAPHPQGACPEVLSSMILPDFCSGHAECGATEYCSEGASLPITTSEVLPPSRCEPCSRCCHRQDAIKENGVAGQCPVHCSCPAVALSCRRLGKVFCFSTKTCAERSTEGPVLGCAACPDPIDTVWNLESQSCTPCEDDNIYYRQVGSRYGVMGSMLGEKCSRRVCELFGKLLGGGGGMAGTMVKMMNSTCAASCTSCAAATAYQRERQSTAQVAAPNLSKVRAMAFSPLLLLGSLLTVI